MKPFLIGCAILLAACGGSSLSVAPSPTPAPAPPPPLSLSGPWGGALAGSIDGVPFSRGVTVSVEHTGQPVTGTYAAGETGQRGSFAFDLTSLGLDAQIVNGVWNIDAPSTDAAVRCTGTAALA